MTRPPFDTVASPAIGVRQEPSSAAWKARSQASASLGIVVVERRDDLARARVGLADLDADGALRERGQRNRSSICVARRSQAEALQPGEREQHRIHLAGVELAQARVDIAAQQHDVEIGTRAQRPAPARRTELVPTRAPFGSSCERARLVRDERRRADLRAAATPRWRGRAAASTGTSFIECTARSMRPLKQRVFEFLDEQALAAGIGERTVLDAVAGGLQDHDLAGGAGRDQQRAHHVRLDQRELGAAGAEAERPSFMG